MIFERYFPEMTERQREQLSALTPIYKEWNARINLISRKDTEEFEVRHVLHSLAIAKAVRFPAGARVLDVGTGGGFPGIPLAILFPEAHFTLVDSIGKKIKVVEAVAEALGLENVTAINARAESLPGRFDYVVSRAVTRMKAFVGWVWPKIDAGTGHGIYYLKGGDLAEELAEAGKRYELRAIGEFFDEEFFATKSVVFLPR